MPPGEELFQMAVFTSLYNVRGQPAVSLAAHMSAEGLPVGVQLVGGPFDQAGLLRVAAQLEEAAPWARPLPQRY